MSSRVLQMLSFKFFASASTVTDIEMVRMVREIRLLSEFLGRAVCQWSPPDQQLAYRPSSFSCCNNTFNEIHRSFTPQIADNGTLTTGSEVTRG